MLSKVYSNKKNTCEVTFTLPVEATEAKAVIRVLGDFNDWSFEKAPVMKAKADEYQATLELECGRSYEFRYLINELVWENDWSADAYAPSPYAGVFNSVVTVNGVNGAAKKSTKAPKAEAAPKAAKTPKVVAAPKAEAPTKTKAVAKTVKVEKTVKADDLTLIEGIGPKIAEMLTKNNIVTFQDLAKAKIDTLQTILKNAGSRYAMHDPTTWTKQADLAAKGKMAELKTMQDSLKGGKK